MSMSGETSSPARRIAVGIAAILVAIAFVAASLQRNSPLAPASVRIGSVTARVVFGDGGWDVSRIDLLSWVEQAGAGVHEYFGGFSSGDFLLQIRSRRGGGVRNGRTRYVRGPEILIRVGRSASRGELLNDWVLSHEMAHLAFPSVSDAPQWLDEGMATYTEPLCRILAGTQTPRRMWYELMRDMPQGQPGPFDRGLNHDQEWGRVYWGGALFFLVADVEIRERTNNQKGLREAIRAMVGRSDGRSLTVRELLSIGDEAVGVPVLSDVYRRQALAAETVDLESLWRRLGVRRGAGTALFDDSAPLAHIRRAITAK